MLFFVCVQQPDILPPISTRVDVHYMRCAAAAGLGKALSNSPGSIYFFFARIFIKKIKEEIVYIYTLRIWGFVGSRWLRPPSPIFPPISHFPGARDFYARGVREEPFVDERRRRRGQRYLSR